MNESPQVLIAARLSRIIKGRDQVSIERQDDAGVRRATELGCHDPIIAADPGVSGSVSPFKRPDLGPYLSDTPPRPWSTLVAAAMDRLGRNARDLAELRSWCEDHGKTIILLSPDIQWPPKDENDFSSRIVWIVLEQLAEIELRTTKKRYADTRAYLRSQQALMGKKTWGFKITGRVGQKTLTPDPDKLRYLLSMIEMAEAGQSMTDIAAWLDSQGAEPAGEKGCTVWDPKSVSQVLRNESLHGVRRENGKILLRHEGVIDKERWDKLQLKLDGSLKRRGPTRNDPMILSDVIYCPTCQGVMHGRRVHARQEPKQHQERDRAIYAKVRAGVLQETIAKEYGISRQRVGDIARIYARMERGEEIEGYVWSGYRCDGKPRQPSKCKNMIPAAEIEQWVNETLTTVSPDGDQGLFAYADQELRQLVYVPAKGYADEIQEIDEEIDALDRNQPDYRAEHAHLMDERDRLIALGTEPAHVEEFKTGILLRDYWPTLSPAGKRDYLIRAGVKVYASKDQRWIEGDPSRIMGALTMGTPLITDDTTIPSNLPVIPHSS